MKLPWNIFEQHILEEYNYVPEETDPGQSMEKYILGKSLNFKERRPSC